MKRKIILALIAINLIAIICCVICQFNFRFNNPKMTETQLLINNYHPSVVILGCFIFVLYLRYRFYE